MNHWKLVNVVACTFLSVAVSACSSQQDQGELVQKAESALLNGDQFLYFTCNATSWNPAEATRLKSTSDPAVLTLDYQVTQPWMVTGNDQCGFLLTNQLNGYGTSQVRYSDSRPQAPLVVPGSDRLVASSATFLVKYPATGTYRLAVNWTQKTFTVSKSLTAEQRLAACAVDPRVEAGLVSAEICAGADIFFRETFNGNGRTCGSCHPADNNTTLDIQFVQDLHARNPRDPLFVNEFDPNLATLESSDLLEAAAIRENVDGFQNLEGRFVSRSVSHLLSLATSIEADRAAGESPTAPLDRLGWGGDGVEDGSLLTFLTGAIKQHFPKDLRRRPDIDFRLPTPLESSLTRDFQLSLGRLNELDLEQVRVADELADDGRQAFISDRGRCNVCHFNAGANFQDTGKNRNFDNGINLTVSNRSLTLPFDENGVPFGDGGFGGQEDTVPDPITHGFGDGTFSPPPLIEAADTGPFFHSSFVSFQAKGQDNFEEAVNFYRLVDNSFQRSSGGAFIEQRFGTPLSLQPDDALRIARFLRVLNAALNVDIAKQRLEAARTLVNRDGDRGLEIQKRLLELAVVEVNDALEVLVPQASGGESIYPDANTRLEEAKSEVSLALSANSSQNRQARIESALAKVAAARSQYGTNINFTLGQGNLMF